MKRFRLYSLLTAYLALLLALLAVGCSLREDPPESLELSGNHSPGLLTMVTTDTSSDGFHYLEPAISRDGTRVIFTCDWAALPPPGQAPDEIPVIRNMAMMNIPIPGTEPQVRQRLADAGAQLVLIKNPCNVVLAPGTTWTLYPLTGEARSSKGTKGSPNWVDDTHVLFWMNTDRGDRLFTIDFDLAWNDRTPVLVYLEPGDLQQTGRYWQHHDPAVSPDGQWVVFTRFGSSRTNPDSLGSYTDMELWCCSLSPTPPTPKAFPLTSGTNIMGAPDWSPDGRSIALHSTLRLIGSGTDYGTELFTMDFDTTGLAANGGVTRNRGLRRVTYTTVPVGSPIPITNEKPIWSADGGTLLFVSSRRAPSITLRERSIWRVPADGSLEPSLGFFTREDDIDPVFFPNSNNQIMLCSAVGFPTEMLDRIEAETRERLAEENPTWDMTQIEQAAAGQREELEYFEGVMTHLFIYSGW